MFGEKRRLHHVDRIEALFGTDSHASFHFEKMRLFFCLWLRPVARFWPADMLVRCVIAWAEDLPDAVAARWLAGAGVELLDLLIASEYWLCFYSLRSQGAAQANTNN